MKSKYIIDPNGRYDSVVGSAIRYGIGLPLIALLLWVLFSMCGCKSQCVPELIETHDTIVRVDSVYKERVRDSIVYKDSHDSTYIYEKDSVNEKQKGDTVYVTKWRVKYHYIYKAKTSNESTASTTTDAAKSSDKEKKQEKEVIVKETRYIPKFYKVVTWTAIVWLLIRIVWCILGWIPQTSPWRNMVQSVIDKIVKFLRLR